MKRINIINHYKQYGFWDCVKRVFNRLGFVYYNRNLLFFHMELTNTTDEFIEPYTFHVATIDDIQKEQNYYDGLYTKEHAIQLLQNGNRLLLLKVNEKIATYQWLEFKKVKIKWLDLHFDIPKYFAYYKSTYTIPELRGTGLGLKTNNKVLHSLKKEGFNHLVNAIDPTNTASIKLCAKVGFKEYQRVHYRRYCHLRYYHVIKANSQCSKKFITLFKSPKNLWKIYLD